MSRVIIYGSGYSFSSKYFTDRSIQHWAVGSLYPELKNNIDAYFCMHQGQTIDFGGTVLNIHNYPLKEIEEKFNSKYFTNSIAYMIAYALYKGYDDIYLSGVDLSADDEYAFERPCVLYWMGIAKGLGVNIDSAAELDKPYFHYGYEDFSRVIDKMEKRKQWAATMAEKMQDAGKQQIADQFLGQYADIKYWINELRG